MVALHRNCKVDSQGIIKQETKKDGAPPTTHPWHTPAGILRPLKAQTSPSDWILPHSLTTAFSLHWRRHTSAWGRSIRQA